MVAGLVFVGLVCLGIGAFAFMGYQSRSGAAPGMRDGHLARCSNKPNCLSSENPKDKKHFVVPMAMPDEGPDAARAALRRAINAMAGQINVDDQGYMAATFKSRIFGFVDDLEIRLDPEGRLIHIRSGSRVGYSDRGVNRKRIELLRDLFAKGTA